MARTSRNAEVDPVSKTKPYRAGLYVRLSDDDDDGKKEKRKESNSVKNQRALLTNFVFNCSDMEIYDYYVDDGWSGVNFNRPNFQRMIRDIESEKINCIIVKDLSRLGRNYVDVGKYTDQYFPEHNIRFISINDNIDRKGANYDFEMITPIKSIFNENYSRDISRKINSAFKIKELEGQFIGAFASYGYQKDPQNHNHLIIDPIASQVVKKVFELFLEGKSQLQISKILNNDKIPCPSEYKKMNGLKYNNGMRLELTKYWTYPTIHNMLRNEIYTGTMVQHKNVRSNFRTKKSTITEKENWIKVPNTHEAIIGREMFQNAQILLQKDTRQLHLDQNIHLLAGFVKCGDCGRAMVKVNRHGKYSLICGTYSRLGKEVCTQHCISYDVIQKGVLKAIQNFVSENINVGEAIRQAENNTKANGQKDISAQQIKVLQNKLDRVLFLKKGLYEDFKEDILTKKEYLALKSDYANQEMMLQQQIENLQKDNQPIGKVIQSEWFRNLKKYQNITELDRNILAAFIDRINVYEGKKVEIIFRDMEKSEQLKEVANHNHNI